MTERKNFIFSKKFWTFGKLFDEEGEVPEINRRYWLKSLWEKSGVFMFLHIGLK